MRQASRSSDIAHQGSVVILSILRLAHVITRKSSALTGDLGITPQQWVVLGALSQYEQPPLLTELGRDLLVSKQNTAGMVERLVELKIVERVADPSNKHLVRVKLTKSGWKLVERLQPRQDRWVEKTFGALTPTERKALARNLSKFFDSVSGES